MLKVEWFGCLRGGDPTSPSNNRVTNSCRKASNKKKKERERERGTRSSFVWPFVRRRRVAVGSTSPR